MRVIATALKELMDLGVTGDALVAAIERMEAAAYPVSQTQTVADVVEKTPGAARTQRWRERTKASLASPKASQTSRGDASVTLPDKDPQTPKTNPETHPPLVPLKGDSFPPPKSQRDDEFEQWWANYPRKVGKAAARKAYWIQRKQASADILRSSLDATTFDRDPQFIPHPATWLNQERWSDVQPQAPPGVVVETDPWPKRLREFERNGYWNTTDWGPKPGKPGSLAPVRGQAA